MTKMIDLAGKRFGKLVVVGLAERREGGPIRWVCRCDCGNIHEVSGSNLRCGNVKSCGCETQKMRVKSWRKNHVFPEPNVKCPICGKEFHIKPYALKKAKNHYCSKECQNKARKEYMRGSGNHQYGRRGELNASWGGGTRISHYGYRLVQQMGHPFSVGRAEYVFEHRIVAEKYLLNEENSVEIDGKMYLSPDYVVHHKNGNRLDNRVENLEVMTLSEHQRLHAKEQSEKMSRGKDGRFIGGSTGV